MPIVRGPIGFRAGGGQNTVIVDRVVAVVTSPPITATVAAPTITATVQPESIVAEDDS